MNDAEENKILRRAMEKLAMPMDCDKQYGKCKPLRIAREVLEKLDNMNH